MLKEFHNRLSNLELLLNMLEHNAAPTFPIYDSSNYPQDAINGQIALTSTNEIAWYSSDAWHTKEGSVISLPNPPQDAIQGQIVIGDEGSILFFKDDSWYQVTTAVGTVASAPQDLLVGQIIIGSDDNLYVTPDASIWYTTA